MNKKVFINLIQSIVFTSAVFIFNVVCLFGLVSCWINSVKTSVFILSTILLIMDPLSIFALRRECWRYYKIDNDAISSGGFLRKKTTINIVSIKEIKEIKIPVYRFLSESKLEDIMFEMSDYKKQVIIPKNTETSTIVRMIEKNITNQS